MTCYLRAAASYSALFWGSCWPSPGAPGSSGEIELPCEDQMGYGTTPVKCWWSFTGEFYKTECGQEFQINHGAPSDNGMIYCFFCGRRIAVQEKKGES